MNGKSEMSYYDQMINIMNYLNIDYLNTNSDYSFKCKLNNLVNKLPNIIKNYDWSISFHVFKNHYESKKITFSSYNGYNNKENTYVYIEDEEFKKNSIK